MLTLGSLFDGIGGWQLAAVQAGIKPVWASEIDKFPAAVTKKHFPETVQLGDINNIDGAKIPPVDIICSGSPCQGLSNAGKRKGLQDERSGLFNRSVEVFYQMRTATAGRSRGSLCGKMFPALSPAMAGVTFRVCSGKSAKPILQYLRPADGGGCGMVRTEHCDIAWRVLDAQFWGVPQRRKRIFLVADFAEKGRCADKILFVG